MGASTCASGSQVWNGNIGTLIANARKKAPNSQNASDPSPPLCVEVRVRKRVRSEEHTSELQSQSNLVCRLLLEKKKNNQNTVTTADQLRPRRLYHFVQTRV